MTAYCPDCGVTQPDASRFCPNCGRPHDRSLPPPAPAAPSPPAPAGPAHPRRSHGVRNALLLVGTLLSLAIVLYAVQGPNGGQSSILGPAATPTPAYVIAPELNALHSNPNQSLTMGEGTKLCAGNLMWSDVQRSPALYRGRCAVIVGDVSVTDPNAALVKVGPEPLLGMPVVLVNLGNYNTAKLWAGHSMSPIPTAVGTIQGTLDGLIYIIPEAIWMQ